MNRTTPQAGIAGRPLQLTDATRLSAPLGAGAFAPAEYCFANLWLFRARHDYRLCEEPFPHIRGRTYDGVIHALPLSPLTAESVDALLASGVNCLYPLGTEAVSLARRLGLDCAHNPADSDYWYDAADLATLRTSKVRRAQARQFAADFAPTFEAWNEKSVGKGLEVLEGWASDVARAVAQTDLLECREAIVQAVALGLDGGVVSISSGIPVAFLLASRAGDARVVHFAKGRRAYSSSYPWMFSTYAAVSGATWVNFEQDLGNEGLAQSKRAYGPARVAPKHRLKKSLSKEVALCTVSAREWE